MKRGYYKTSLGEIILFETVFYIGPISTVWDQEEEEEIRCRRIYLKANENHKVIFCFVPLDEMPAFENKFLDWYMWN